MSQTSSVSCADTGSCTDGTSDSIHLDITDICVEVSGKPFIPYYHPAAMDTCWNDKS